MSLARLNVMIGIAKLERITKSDAGLAPLVASARDLVSRPTAPAQRAHIFAATAGVAL